MDNRQEALPESGISPQLFQRLQEELARNPEAIENLRGIAARVHQSGRYKDLQLISIEIEAMKEMVERR